ncbi:hypothetical protein NL676_005570 [Syzygium grande]|nr:hypothetical protein NL676_005570 [Syzygium grande]
MYLFPAPFSAHLLSALPPQIALDSPCSSFHCISLFVSFGLKIFSPIPERISFFQTWVGLVSASDICDPTIQLWVLLEAQARLENETSGYRRHFNQLAVLGSFAESKTIFRTGTTSINIQLFETLPLVNFHGKELLL